MNISKTHHKIFLIGLVIVFVGMYVIIFKNTDLKNNSSALQPMKQNENHLFTSNFLEFRFSFPKSYSIVETVNTITLSKNDNLIVIEKIYGYSNSINEYLEILKEKNNLKINPSSIGQQYGFEVFNIEYYREDPVELAYFKSLGNNSFVSISTSSPDLYDDLDQIAASFEYLGDTGN